MTTISPGDARAVLVAVRPGAYRIAEGPGPMPVPSSLTLADVLAQPYLELTAWPGAVPCARYHARESLSDVSRKELIQSVELVVSEFVGNAVRASEGLDAGDESGDRPVIRLWLGVEDNSALVLVWDASSSLPQRQELTPDAENGRGLLLVDALSLAWGSFELAEEPGKVVWSLCQS